MMNTEQMEMGSVEQLVSQKHTYRELKELLAFERITKSVKVKTSEPGAIGYGNWTIVCAATADVPNVYVTSKPEQTLITRHDKRVNSIKFQHASDFFQYMANIRKERPLDAPYI